MYIGHVSLCSPGNGEPPTQPFESILTRRASFQSLPLLCACLSHHESPSSSRPMQFLAVHVSPLPSMPPTSLPCFPSRRQGPSLGLPRRQGAPRAAPPKQACACMCHQSPGSLRLPFHVSLPQTWAQSRAAWGTRCRPHKPSRCRCQTRPSCWPTSLRSRRVTDTAAGGSPGVHQGVNNASLEVTWNVWHVEEEGRGGDGKALKLGQECV